MDYIVETQFEGPGFVAVPNAVAQMPGLAPDALGVLVWLASLPKGYAIRRATLLDRFQIGKDKWQRIARDLASVGALIVEKKRGPDGRFTTRYIVRWPDVSAVASPGPENPAPVKPGPENPPQNGGKPAKNGRKTRLPIKTKKEKPRARENPPCEGAISAPASGAAPGPEGQAQAQAAQAGAGRPDPWTRASQAAALGLPWVDPSSGVWRSASEFPDAAQCSSGAPVAGSG